MRVLAVGGTDRPDVDPTPGDLEGVTLDLQKIRDLGGGAQSEFVERLEFFPVLQVGLGLLEMLVLSGYGRAPGREAA